MRESGVVLKKDAAGIAVRMQSGFSCEGCTACHIEQGKDHILLIQQDLPVQPGEKVEVEINPRFSVLAIFLIFFLPLLMLIVGYYLFQNYQPMPGVPSFYQGIAGAIIGFILSYVFTYFYDRRLKNSSSQKNIQISRIIE
jgi:positive regulator of sigma E activity